MTETPIINALAFTDEGFKERKPGKTYIFDINYKIDGSDYWIRYNLDRVLNLLNGGEDESDETYPYSYTNEKVGELVSAYFDGYPNPEVQRDIEGFKEWFKNVVELWCEENNCPIIREKEELKEKYFLKINCSIPDKTTTP